MKASDTYFMLTFPIEKQRTLPQSSPLNLDAAYRPLSHDGKRR